MLLHNRHLIRLSCWPSTAALLALALLGAGCSGGLSLGGAPASDAAASSDPSFKDRISNFFSGASARSPQTVAGADTPVDCPLIDIRQGASTLTIGATSNTGDDTTNTGAMALKYQGSFVRAARECARDGPNMVMKVGVEGRIIIGPAGGPGQVDVPLRIAVVKETTHGTVPIITKFISVPVTIASATDNPTFTHIEEGVIFPMPSAADADEYVVYVGFDPLAAEAQKAKPAAKPKPKAKPKAKLTPAPGTG
jgi:hypothetical protein